MRAAKGNREYVIDESQKKHYQDAGYDIIDENGAVIAYGRGKTVSYDEHMKLKAELAAVQKENEELKAELEAAQMPAADAKEKRGTKKAGE